MRPIVLACAIVLATATCSSLTSTARGLSVQLQATPLVAQTGDTVTFTVSVIASSVSVIVISFADGTGDQFSAGGAPSVQATFKHVYANGGNYLARATVTDADAGNRVVTQLIVVNPRTDPVSAASRFRETK